MINSRKKCIVCKQKLYIKTEFSNNSTKTCIKCCKKRSLQYNTLNREKLLESSLRRNYNLTLEEYYKLLENQNSLCAICEEYCKSGKRLSVDHNHDTGEIRGLLCQSCNFGLGKFNDNPVLVEKALLYLKR